MIFSMAAAAYNQGDADEEKEKTVCFRLWDVGGSRFDWYKLDLKKMGGGSVLKMGCPPLISSRARRSSVVSLGSVIYVLGGGRIQVPVNGDYGLRDDIYSFGTRSPESVWKEAPRMLCPGWFTAVASLATSFALFQKSARSLIQSAIRGFPFLNCPLIMKVVLLVRSSQIRLMAGF